MNTSSGRGIIPVKSNPVRRVWREGDEFFKSEKRKLFYSKAASEYRSLRFLARIGVPAVEALRVYSEGKFDVLATRAFADDAVDCNACWEQCSGMDEVFVRGYFAFVSEVLAAPLWHPDFHNGNVLYSPASGKFALVDVYGVKRRRFFHRLPCFRRRMTRIVLEAREFVPYAELREIYRKIAGGGDDDFDAALKREAAFLRREWPKRRAQILTCYPKFAEKGEDGVEYSRNAARKRYALETEKIELPPEEAEKVWLGHFFLQLGRLPHAKIAGRGENFVLREKNFVMPPGFARYYDLAGIKRDALPAALR